MADPSRLIRLRQSDQNVQAETLRRPSPAIVNRQLVRVFDGGSMPATADHVVWTHPVSIDGDETEGATPSYLDDTGVVIPVVIVGSTVPADGDLLVATAIGGRWVGSKKGGNGPAYTCGPFPCDLPRTGDLVLTSYQPDYGGPFPTDVSPMVRSGLDTTPIWTTTAYTGATSEVWRLRCVGSSWLLEQQGLGGTRGYFLVPLDARITISCSPLSIVLTLPGPRTITITE